MPLNSHVMRGGEKQSMCDNLKPKEGEGLNLENLMPAKDGLIFLERVLP